MSNQPYAVLLQIIKILLSILGRFRESRVHDSSFGGADGSEVEMKRLPREFSTARCVMRVPSVSHASALFEIYGDPAAMKYMQKPVYPSVEACASKIASWIDDFSAGRSFRWGIYLPSAPSSLVGTAALHFFSPSNNRIELGLDLAPCCWGRGYATEITRELIHLAFDSLGVNRIELRCNPSNAASVAIALKLGFSLEGVLRDYVFVPGSGYVDEAVYSLLASER